MSLRFSPVAPSLDGGPQPDLGFEDPFERRAVVTLTRALRAARDAASEATATGSLSGFLEAVDVGLTANLCSAVASMSIDVGNGADLVVAVSFSPTRPAEEEIASVRFTPDAGPLIKEAAKVLRETAPVDDYFVLGLVLKLEQKPGQAPDRAWIVSVADESPRTVVLTLDEQDREVAIAAFRDRTPVSAMGRLTRNGPFFQLSLVRDFRAVATAAIPE